MTTLKTAEEETWPEGYPDEHKTGKPIVMWEGGSYEINKRFRVVANTYYGGGAPGMPGARANISMTAEVQEGHDSLGQPRWVQISDVALESKLIAMAVYAKLVGIPTVVPE